MTYREEGRHWWEWHQLSELRLNSPLMISFANVGTHNHLSYVEDASGFITHMLRS
jgi:hypothetical protein